MHRYRARVVAVKLLRDPSSSKATKVARGEDLASSPRITPGFVVKHGVNTQNQVKERPASPAKSCDDDWWLGDHRPDSVTVFEEEPGVECTGLVDARGVGIVKERIRHPIGFQVGRGQ